MIESHHQRFFLLSEVYRLLVILCTEFPTPLSYGLLLCKKVLKVLNKIQVDNPYNINSEQL